jgi:Concanavalin A-like lectin/glucanases superfamily
MSKRRSARAVSRRAVIVAAAGIAAVYGLGARTAVADPTLLGQWRFDESDGQLAVDDGPRRLSGVLGRSSGADPADPGRVAGASGRALHFDGNTFVRLPDSAALAVGSLTTEAVVRAGTSPGSWRYLVSRGGRSCVAGSYGLYTGAAGGLALYVYDGTRYVVSATARPADIWNGAWHHVAGTFDGRTLRLYVDGRPVGQPMDARLNIEYAGASTRASFGEYAGSCALGFRGDMDLVRLWSGARSAEAIAQAAAGVSPVPSGPGRLPAAAPGAVIGDDGAKGGGGGSTSQSRRCVVKLVRKRTRGRRLTLVRVRVIDRTQPLAATPVIARRAGMRKVLARARTDAKGRARLTLRARRSGRVKITVKRHPGCTPVRLRVRGS